MVRHLITSLVVGWMFATPIYAQQTHTVEGVVTAEGSGAPLGGVTIRIAGHDGLGALSDSRGAFRIVGVPSGPQMLIVENLGWETLQTDVDVRAGMPAVRLQLRETAVAVAGVTVTASGAPQRQMTSTVAVGAVTGRELRETKPAHPSQIVGRIAGVHVSVAGSGEGHMTAIRQPLTTNPVYLYLEDGIPTRSTGFFNHNAMYEVTVPQAGRIEVLKGPGTALFGSDAIGGVINVQTHAPSEGPTVSMYAEGGSHTWGRALFSVSDTRGRDGLRFDLNLTRWTGWRDAANYDRQSATVRWDRELSGDARLKTVLTYSQIDQIDASALSREEFEVQPELNYYRFTTRNIRSFRVSTNLDASIGGTQVSVTPYVRSADMDLVPFFMLAFDPVIYETGHKSAGVLLRGRREMPSLRSTVTAGVDVDYSPGGRTEHQITMTRDGKTFSSFETAQLLYDYDVTFAGVSPYAQIEVSPVSTLHLTAGARYDAVGYEYDNHLEPISTGRWRRPSDTSLRYAQLSPKLGAAFEIAPWLGTFASYRESFRAPSESQIFRQGSSLNTTELKPIVAKSSEVGARGIIADIIDYDVSLYDMRVLDDILTFIRSDGVREVQNAGETRHRGVEVGAGAQLASWLRLDLAQSWGKQTYERWEPRPTLNYAGNEVERAPRAISNVRLRAKAPGADGALATLEWSRISQYWENPENTQMYEGHALLHASVAVPLKWGVVVTARMMNITDARYAEHASYNIAEGELLQPGAPRMLYIGLQRNWQ